MKINYLGLWLTFLLTSCVTCGAVAGFPPVSIQTGNGLSLTSLNRLNLQLATNSQPGALSAADHTAFSSLAGLTFIAPLVNTAGNITCNVASGSVVGCLSTASFSTFNNKLGPTSGSAIQKASGGGLAPAVADTDFQNPLTLAAFGSSPSANGATFSSDILTLQPADATHPGGITASSFTQIFAGLVNYLSSTTSTYAGTGSTLSFTGANNAVFGVGAASGPLSSGADNTLLGHNSAPNVTTGARNVCLGSASCTSSSATMNDSVAIGFNAALPDSTNSNQSIAVGSGSAAGQQGIALGYQAGANNSFSICIGYLCGILNTGPYSIAMGVETSAGHQGDIAIGHGVSLDFNNSIALVPGDNTTVTAPATAANQLVIGDSRSDSFISQIWLGQGAVSVPSPTNVSMQLTGASGSNVTGSNFTIAPGNGTGTGGSGNLIFQTAPSGASSSIANTPTTALEITPSGIVSVQGILSLIVQGSGVTPTCAGGNNGNVALTHAYLMCVCNGTGWVETSDGSTACTF